MFPQSTIKQGLWIGVDPGNETGLAFWDSYSRKIRNIQTVDIVAAMFIIKREAIKTGFRGVVLENPDLNTFMYSRHFKGLSNTELTVLLKKAQDVGKNKRDAQILTMWCNYHQIPVEFVKPSKDSPKWDSATMAKLTGIKRSSQHERDAAKLVVGK